MKSNTVRVERDPRRWWVLGVLCLSLLVLVVDNSVLNLAIPALMIDLGAGPADIQWIIDAYILVFAGLLLTAGSLSDRYGRKRFLIIGLVLFGGASLAALAVTEPWHLVAVRALMGVGGSILMPSTLSILITVFDDAERPKAIAAWSTVAMVGVVAGPTLGGFLLGHYWWGSIFLLNVPVAAVAIVAALVLMPESRGPARRLDPVGVVLSILGMTALVYAVISAPAAGWTSAGTLAPAAVAVLALGGFVFWERRASHPMLPLELFRDRNFSGASSSIVLMSFGTGALLLMLTQYLQFVLGYDPMEAGLALLPYAVAAALFNPVGAGLAQRLGNRTLIIGGFLVMALGFGVLAFMTAETGYGMLVAGLVLMGVGGGLGGPAAYATLMGAVPPAHAGVGSALNDTVQQTGMALSVAVLGSVLTGVYTSAMPADAPAAARESIGGALLLKDPAVAEAAREAFVSAMSLGSWVGVAFILAAAALAFTVLRPAPVVTADPADGSAVEPAKADGPAAEPAKANG
ncbi:EmrB/QacA subfamily drug resistance transporter [Streptosporangium becharense]|uniref:EmrB/QacA subfamily drug resistance transporter n=1 Tax=Streptosporangium becharense TaxID=1816182 RepID=A0A7W9IDY5_9ACTN|nr:MFS transporter [Streptosporangium becharense]MBB2915563.1 EmrB/QacA subfamily drug resistance transporter [Streptosporangium becharense]MBB5818910.1 EmrB/QacA subfamily drug resistance transporter [Streptosporangium becharense]